MATSPARIRSIYRSLLRELPPRPILESPRSGIHSRLRTHFSAQQPDSSLPAAVKAGQAQQLAAYLRSQRCYVDLIERYNPGMNMEDDERIRLTARRVGMDLPVEYQKGSQ
ncbi:unnamed protein product [Clonostachys solani]|uniref:ATP synthase assembly factor FMC1 n=1 Tax=Clonostachys solani TaxID=160281 RepID=A0A9P0EL89_9HYPO|nr:unnamed protein product [Clonostachys solani]